MAVKIKKGSALDTINLTPMIDVVFQLLIFFLVATQFAEEDREMDVELPSASAAVPLTATPNEVFVNIDASGAFFMGGTQMDSAEVLAALRQAVVDNPQQSVVIRADKRVVLQAAVEIMDLCNQAGVLDYTITTEGGGG